MTIANAAAVVTGGTEGIGLATVRALGQAGARVAFCARSTERVAAIEATLRAEGLAAHGFPCDVTDPDQVRRFAEDVRAAMGDPTILINNAGIGRFGPLDEMALETWDAVHATNVRSLFLVTKAFLSPMKVAGRGDIVVVASLAGKNGIVGGTAYTASKHAALGFAKSLLLEVRPHGVRVVAVCPGSVDTAFFAGREPRTARASMLQPSDVAEAIVATLRQPRHATISELDIRPAHPTT